MKTILLSTVLLVALISTAIAGPVHTVLNLRMFDGRPITVMVDGVQRGAVASQHEIINLTPGVHRLRIYSVQHHPFGWNGGAMVPVFRGNVEIFADYAVYTFIDRYGKLVVEDYEAMFCEPAPAPIGSCGTGMLPLLPNHPTGGNWNNGGGWNNNNGGNWNNNNGGWNQGGNYRTPMHQEDFRQLLSVIESKSFESTKQQIAMGALDSNYFTSAQIGEMLDRFTFESTKVEVAKRAYERVIDQDKFYLVYNSFTFESSITDLVSLKR